MVVLVTGASGQLGQAIQFIATSYPDYQFIFASSQDLDIVNLESVTSFFETNTIDFCINAAAYTAVDKAESEPEKAYAVNVLGPKNLSQVCNKHRVKLIHISTDFVFDGSSKTPYLETDTTMPLSVYGSTKREGELEIIKNCQEYFILRTSWVYSQFGNNFMKTMLRLAVERDHLNIVSDQIGSPTNAVDLARAALSVIRANNSNFGIYNFSNEGTASWFDFAKEIFKVNNITISVNPISTEAFPTPATRPKYSVLDKMKIKTVFNLEIKNWKDALQQTIL